MPISQFNLVDFLLDVGAIALNILTDCEHLSLCLDLQIHLRQPPIVLLFQRTDFPSGSPAPLQQLHRPEVLPILLLQSCHPTLVQRLCRGKGFYICQSLIQRESVCPIKRSISSGVVIWCSRRKANCSLYRLNFITSCLIWAVIRGGYCRFCTSPSR